MIKIEAITLQYSTLEDILEYGRLMYDQGKSTDMNSFQELQRKTNSKYQDIRSKMDKLFEGGNYATYRVSDTSIKTKED